MMTVCQPLRAVGYTQASSVMPPMRSSEAESLMLMRSLTPSKDRAWPARPAVVHVAPATGRAPGAAAFPERAGGGRAHPRRVGHLLYRLAAAAGIPPTRAHTPPSPKVILLANSETSTI